MSYMSELHISICETLEKEIIDKLHGRIIPEDLREAVEYYGGDTIELLTEIKNSINDGIWYAIMEGEDDDDWGIGSRSPHIATMWQKKAYPSGYIAVIDDSEEDPVCINTIQG